MFVDWITPIKNGRTAHLNTTPSKHNDLSVKSTAHFATARNYGVLGGHGHLVILDFDVSGFAEHLLRNEYLYPTFTVLSAGKRLPHMYYHLVGEMIGTTRILHPRNKTTVVDIIAQGAGVIGPGSQVKGRRYEVYFDLPINPITVDQLTAAFGPLRTVTKRRNGSVNGDVVNTPEVAATRVELERIGLSPRVVTTNSILYACPFHPMTGGGNLTILPDTGDLWCFHEQKHWTLNRFKAQLSIRRML